MSSSLRENLSIRLSFSNLKTSLGEASAKASEISLVIYTGVNNEILIPCL